jgi:hypothetical protein
VNRLARMGLPGPAHLCLWTATEGEVAVAVFTPLLDMLEEVPDARRAEGRVYKLPHVLLFAILATVTGSNPHRGIATFTAVHRRKLNAAVGLAWKRAPAHTATRHILKGLDPAAVEAAFRRHAARLQAARATPGRGSIALDGKTLRGSFDRFQDRAAAQALSAFATDTALVLPSAGFPPATQSEPLPAPPTPTSPTSPTRSRRRRRCSPNSAWRRAPSSPSTPCTAKKHFEVAAEAEPTLTVQVKDNQPTLRDRVRQVCATTPPLGSAHSHDLGRNRDERRRVTVFDPAEVLAGTDWQPRVAAVIRVERDVFTRNTRTGPLRHSAEIAFHVANAAPPAERAAAAIRAHWKIETTSHHSRDATLGEDRSRIRTNPGVFARLRSFAFNILKANRTDTLSQDRYRAALAGVKRLLRMLAIPWR